MKEKLIKTFLWILAIALVGLLVISYFTLRGQARYSVYPYLTTINIRHDRKSKDLLPEELIISQLPLDLKDSTLQAVNTEMLEETLKEKIPFIKSVDAYVSPSDHRLNISVVGRKPVLRLFTSGGSYFLDEEGNTLATKGGVAVYLPVIKIDHLNDEIQKEVLMPLAHFLHKNEKWYAFFGMIEVLPDYKIHFYPRVGDYIFETIGADHLEDDFEKIPIFYNKIVPQVGANKYRLVKLSYDNQIVCQKNTK